VLALATALRLALAPVAVKYYVAATLHQAPVTVKLFDDTSSYKEDVEAL
jgi:hypothetical protein